MALNSIKIAPNVEDIQAQFNSANRLIVWTEFNGQRISFILNQNVRISDFQTICKLRESLRIAILMSSKTWQLREFMDMMVHTKEGKSIGNIHIEDIR